VIVPESSRKKKSAAKKTKGAKKSGQTKRTLKIDVKQIAKPRKKTTVKTKAAGKAKSVPPASRGKAVVSIKTLLFKQYDTGVMDQLAAKSPYKKQAPVEIPESPPFVAGRSKKQVEQIRALLFKPFDMSVKPAPGPKKAKAAKKPLKKITTAKTEGVKKSPPPAKTKAPTKALAKAKPATAAPRGKAVVSIKTLLFKQYDTGVMDQVAAKSPYKKQAPVEIPESPPFVAGGDREETARIRALLFREFNLESQLIPVGIDDAETLKETLEVSTPPSVLPKQEDSGGYALKLGLLGLAVLMTIVIAASLCNRRSFFLKDVGGTVEVWQGKFAPKGSELILSVKDMKMPNPLREIYSKAEVYQLVFNHFRDKADTLLYNPAGPDFSQINECLREAASYAPTQAERMKAQRRLDSIAFLVLLHKVDVALIKGELSDLEGARVILEQGTKYATDDYEHDLIARRKAVLEMAISRLSER
jgi:hypothetical protein